METVKADRINRGYECMRFYHRNTVIFCKTKEEYDELRKKRTNALIICVVKK